MPPTPRSALTTKRPMLVPGASGGSLPSAMAARSADSLGESSVGRIAPSTARQSLHSSRCSSTYRSLEERPPEANAARSSAAMHPSRFMTPLSLADSGTDPRRQGGRRGSSRRLPLVLPQQPDDAPLDLAPEQRRDARELRRRHLEPLGEVTLRPVVESLAGVGHPSRRGRAADFVERREPFERPPLRVVQPQKEARSNLEAGD